MICILEGHVGVRHEQDGAVALICSRCAKVLEGNERPPRPVTATFNRGYRDYETQERRK